MIKRYVEKDLNNWYDNGKKPLLIDGARQVGKTTTIKNFLNKKNSNYIFIDLHSDNDKEMISLIKKHNIHDFVNYLEKKYKTKKEKMTIFFDEIQECKEIVTLFKYFNESYPMIKIIASGSLFSLEFSEQKIFFPVGKITIIPMYPMTFYEFVDSLDRKKLLDESLKCVINDKVINEEIHNELLKLFYDYLFIGGMPEIVNYYIESKEDKTYNQKEVLDLKNNLSNSYFRDIASHFEKSDMKSKVLAILDSLHIQLNNNNKRFLLSMVKDLTTSTKPRMSRYKNTIDKLIISSIVNKLDCSYQLDVPLSNFKNDLFKLYYNDIGFYTIKYSDISPENMNTKNQSWNSIKGGVCENFINNELVYYLDDRKFYFYKNDKGTREMDFVFEKNNKIYLIETISNFNGKSSTLHFFYNDKNKILIKTSLNNYFKNEFYTHIPIYLIGIYIDWINNN